MHQPARPRIWQPRLSTLFIALVAAGLLCVNVTPVVRLKYERIYGFPAHTYYSHTIEVGDDGAKMMLAPAGFRFEGILANAFFAFAALHLAARTCELLKRRLVHAHDSAPEIPIQIPKSEPQNRQQPSPDSAIYHDHKATPNRARA